MESIQREMSMLPVGYPEMTLKHCFFLLPMLMGCHCVQVSERFGDCVDSVADSCCVFDRFYRENLDLTRICKGGCYSGNCHHAVIYPDIPQPIQQPNEPAKIDPPTEAPLIPEAPPRNYSPETSQIPQKFSSVVLQPTASTWHVDALASVGEYTSTEKKLPLPPVSAIPSSNEVPAPTNKIHLTSSVAEQEILPQPLLAEPPQETAPQAPKAAPQPVSAPAGVPPSPQFYQWVNSRQ